MHCVCHPLHIQLLDDRLKNRYLESTTQVSGGTPDVEGMILTVRETLEHVADVHVQDTFFGYRRQEL